MFLLENMRGNNVVERKKNLRKLGNYYVQCTCPYFAYGDV